jgi:hypothetical protein
VLAEGSWRHGKARSELPTVSQGRRRTTIVGNRAPAKIEGLLGAGKHKQGPGKLSRVSGEAMAAAHGDPWFTGERDRAAKATGAWEAYGRGIWNAKGTSTNC